MTNLEIKIYNKHLAVSRSSRNKPFKLKVNFDTFEQDPNNAGKVKSLKRLANFFKRYPDIDMDTYFASPYNLYRDVGYFDLDYFASPRAIKAFTIYKQQLDQQDPDHQIDSVKKSLEFIATFCLDYKIQLHDYSSFKMQGLEPEWVYHFKNNKINLYSLMEFSHIFHYISDMPTDERELLLGSFGEKYLDYRGKYLSSKKLRPFLSEAYIKIKLFIDKSLNSSSVCV